ncbi:intraflagellar transport protein 140 homolog isoform X2 [Acanthaster planci]|uniref:Intraflagellar transport protein 140 homolog isoform X2 n=1 Tax=Acanthaster planci TaxID=133434 RepID=A0A8B7YRZ8_ACAPL|nr:intraflagellar transport protein 140 homolog isoform X2 [Acanthaster planci]
MTVYFDHRVQTPTVGANVDIAWHPTHPYLAVATRGETGGGYVQLYNEEGEPIENSNVQRSCSPSALSWNPSKPSVAVGWENGEVHVWSEQHRELYEAPKVHKGEVCLIAWNDAGSRALTADRMGLVVMWKCDGRGRFGSTPLCKEELNQVTTQCVFQPGIDTDIAAETSALARAAVSGDQRALDMFTWDKNSLKLPGSNNDGLTCYVGGTEGKGYHIDDKGTCSQVLTADGPIKKMLFNRHRNILVVVTQSLMLAQYSLSSDGKTTETMKVKLSGKVTETDCDMVWAGKGLLATASGECVIRMWDLDKDDNYILGLDAQQGFETGECINCVAYSSKKGVLVGGTDKGRVAMWKFAPSQGIMARKQDGETKWKLQAPSVLEGNILQAKWGTSRDYLALNSIGTVVVLHALHMNAHIKDQVAAVQTGPSTMTLDILGSGAHHEVKTDIHIKGIYTTKEHIAIWNGKKVVVYDISSTIRAAGTFSTESNLVCLYEQNAYTTEPGKIQVRTFQGTVKQLIPLNETEGEPATMDITGHFLVVTTTTGFVKVFDVSRREAKPHCSPINLSESVTGLGTITMGKINSNGTKVCVTANKSNGTPNSKLYVWDCDLGTVTMFDLATGRGDQEDYSSQDDEISDAERGRAEAAHDIAGRYPLAIHWDPSEPKLLVCEAKLSESNDKPVTKKSSLLMTMNDSPPDVMIISLFSTLEHGIVLQDGFGLASAYSHLLGLKVPYYFFIRKAGEKTTGISTVSPGSLVAKQVMRDFVGLEEGDKNAQEAMMNFSYFLTIGNMDEAFKAIKLIKSETVWENMAKMCVKTRRLDVAKVCLGNMGHARGARALRQLENEPELDAKVAMLAVQLGQLEDAERLYKNCSRHDLLNEFYQASGQWGKAMETAELQDRIHLRTTYYNYAKHLEAKGDINGAIPNYEKSDTHRFEVPRMLFDEPQALEAYIMKNKDKSLRRWWAQYMESTGEMETALQFYEAGQDFLSLVRVYCYCGNLEKAAEIANDTGDKAACYHLARQYENQDNIKEAIHFFTRAQAYSQAIRLCKENNLEDQLMNLALMSSSEDMIEAARYYETNPSTMDKAVMLFHKGGHFSKALELAFKTQQFGALQLIAEDLDERTDPILLNRCAEFFKEHGQYDKAVDLMVVAKKYTEALDLCQSQSVPITERLAEKMTLSKDNKNSEMRLKLLEKVADICFLQGSYHLATKKYTQAGNKVKAMRALLKSGDTEKIIFFAGVSRQKEIYVMAANYLQSLDWRKDPEIMKNIIGFYTKGRALDSLAGFYDACAQVEIDEYQNYDKALGALSEAYKCLSKAKMKNASLQEEKLGALKSRIGLIKKFVTARRVYDEDPDEAMRQCQILLEEPDLDNAVRIGDVFGMMIEHYARQENFKKAYAFMEDMRGRIPTVNMAYYVNMRTIEAVHRALDIPLGRGIGAETAGGQGEDDDDVEEDVQEDFQEDEGFC